MPTKGSLQFHGDTQAQSEGAEKDTLDVETKSRCVYGGYLYLYQKKMDFKLKMVIGDKECQYMMIKESIHQEIHQS